MPDPIPPLPSIPLPGPTGMGIPSPIIYPAVTPSPLPGTLPENNPDIRLEQEHPEGQTEPEQTVHRRRRRRRDENGNLVEFMPEQVTTVVPEVEETISPVTAEDPGETGIPDPVVRRGSPVAPASPTAIDPNAKPKFWVNVGATVNIGNFENMKIDMGISGIEYDATSEDIENIMESAQVGIHEVVESLMLKVIDRARDIKIARGIPLGGE